jgi:hypothetical protein
MLTRPLPVHPAGESGFLAMTGELGLEKIGCREVAITASVRVRPNAKASYPRSPFSAFVDTLHLTWNS